MLIPTIPASFNLAAPAHQLAGQRPHHSLASPPPAQPRCTRHFRRRSFRGLPAVVPSIPSFVRFNNKI